jgi:hypothetical protein
MAYVFLSHSHEDKPFVRRLAADLRNAGHAVWLDEAEINVGDSLIDKITAGLGEVEFVAAVLSDASIGSRWVAKELEIASNREIRENRVVVLPLLVGDVELPGFLQGKLFADFRTEEKYPTALESLLRALGPADAPPAAKADELEILRAELEALRARANRDAAAVRRAGNAAFLGKSEELKKAIEEANRKYPQHAPINRTYAFEVGGTVVTLDYALWAVAKAMREGTHVLEALLTIYDKWDDIENMLESYSDMVANQVA